MQSRRCWNDGSHFSQFLSLVLSCWSKKKETLRNAVKLAYNPTKAQRDRLYPQRINSFITKPGARNILVWR